VVATVASGLHVPAAVVAQAGIGGYQGTGTGAVDGLADPEVRVTHGLEPLHLLPVDPGQWRQCSLEKLEEARHGLVGALDFDARSIGVVDD